MRIARKSALPLVFFVTLSGLSGTHAFSAAFYTPPCYEKRDTTDDALINLHRCLVRGSRPPFEDPNNVASASFCARELEALVERRNEYKNCLLNLNARPSEVPETEQGSKLK